MNSSESYSEYFLSLTEFYLIRSKLLDSLNPIVLNLNKLKLNSFTTNTVFYLKNEILNLYSEFNTSNPTDEIVQKVTKLFTSFGLSLNSVINELLENESNRHYLSIISSYYLEVSILLDNLRLKQVALSAQSQLEA